MPAFSSVFFTLLQIFSFFRSISVFLSYFATVPTFKHEHLYLMDYASMAEARFGIDEFILYYNDHRLHSSLGYVPQKVAYFDEQKRAIA